MTSVDTILYALGLILLASFLIFEGLLNPTQIYKVTLFAFGVPCFIVGIFYLYLGLRTEN